ncbi:hypothetical protein [Streptomyces sp. ZSW22]|uniref:hypothetical protein n=1 Tax=Streptomyces sp. ZSW22 TaxID=3055050 RepID=UPI0025AFF6C7|nr:hypothetical protein [Streptomyces sp. ZSW22]MDN3244678.1 hypothetical protein [Streptomyces sp. ZSW22]
MEVLSTWRSLRRIKQQQLFTVKTHETDKPVTGTRRCGTRADGRGLAGARRGVSYAFARHS